MIKQKILIVDDTKESIKVLMDILKNPNYEILAATNGKAALKIVASQKPNLILLDIVMPDMDGYEVCTKLKADATTKTIPVIFITAQDEAEDETKGLELGAMDYITKPIIPAIVKARVRTHLELELAYRELEKRNTALEESAILRENVERITRHDLKTPLNGIIGYSSILMEELELEPEYKKMLQNIEKSGYKILDMINRSLDLYKMEMGTYQYKPNAIDILSVIRKISDEISVHAKDKSISMKILLHCKPITQSDTFTVQGEKFLCYPMLANLIKNALEASPNNAILRVSLSTEEKKAIISIHNQGVVPEEIRKNFFGKYTTSGKLGGTGLGTYSAKLMAETQEGNIHFETSDETGTTVTVQLYLASF
ncbi:hybrid sensor histidine kinase/response regulator [Candidatus Parabeggiatoa sp. HSG14]|uniref:hybrid sensor histidine kinase/response regulator n=1 Tax=Candidatus Parabeggiatoa sp. HSG14 TaxID=3055593 RepID=UPI0025A73DA9|nr:hybrid sensor histidine kinase/response regulator [Thiotrichales bacterium HSG14]